MPDLKKKIFLSASWNWLLIVNYEMPPDLLQPYVPQGTELDSFDGKFYASLVGFWFSQARVLRLSIPFHTSFEEVNLRFYVKRVERNEVKRGVVFIKEIVPRWAIAKTARILYNENYISCPMTHQLEINSKEKIVSYSWKENKKLNKMKAILSGKPFVPHQNSFESFIAEHYWGYCNQKNGLTLEYQVEHIPWEVYHTEETEMNVNVGPVYGKKFEPYLLTKPHSSFVAVGSPITVSLGDKVS